MSDIQALLSKNLPTPHLQIHEPQLEERDVQLFLKRDDLIHPEISGNKWRKLKYNLLEAQQQKFNTVLTFGGAYSNHIAATAAACRLAGMKSIGIIRGEELKGNDNSTLRKASEDGMRLEFISRENYSRKKEATFIETLRQQFGDFFMVPEGGANEWGVKGCAEMMQEINVPFDAICVACGTGTTMAGVISGAKPGQKVIGFPVFKNGTFIEKEIQKLSGKYELPAELCELQTAYHFGGYSRYTPELLQFIQDFKKKRHIALDFIYTGKMMYGIYDLIKNGFFPKGSKILAIHTGGLQGNRSIPGL